MNDLTEKEELEMALAEACKRGIDEFHRKRGEVWSGKSDTDPDGKWVKAQ